MNFVWQPEKEQENIKKHGINFPDAVQIFRDPCRIERHDDDNSITEERWQTMGMAGKVLFVVYTERGEDTWIISARKAEPFERRIYYEYSEIYPGGWERADR
ncbi:MAG: BrnT family toxin [Treponema sp.]|jgi:uncharacterized DUF497 family protein|nr:BrnT family toxin [Treponema sp.]